MQSEVFIIPGQQELTKDILRYLKNHQRFYFQILFFWIPQTEEIILANDKISMAKYGHIGRMISNLPISGFTYSWWLHIKL